MQLDCEHFITRTSTTRVGELLKALHLKTTSWDVAVRVYKLLQALHLKGHLGSLGTFWSFFQHIACAVRFVGLMV